MRISVYAFRVIIARGKYDEMGKHSTNKNSHFIENSNIYITNIVAVDIFLLINELNFFAIQKV